MTLLSALAISSQTGSWRTYLMKCSPSPCDETLACDWPLSLSPSPLVLALALALAFGLCSRESTLPKYLLVLLLPVWKFREAEKRSKAKSFLVHVYQNKRVNYGRSCRSLVGNMQNNHSKTSGIMNKQSKLTERTDALIQPICSSTDLFCCPRLR